jgi:hypothetical protein
MGRRYAGIDINPAYVAMAEERVRNAPATPPLLLCGFPKHPSKAELIEMQEQQLGSIGKEAGERKHKTKRYGCAGPTRKSPKRSQTRPSPGGVSRAARGDERPMTETANITTPPRVANAYIQDAVLNVMMWASLGSDACPSCHVSAAARDHMATADAHDWWQFIRKVREWLEDPREEDPAHLEARREAYKEWQQSSPLSQLLPNSDLRGDADTLENPVILETREADGETQQAIKDLISWSHASVQTQCCGNSLGPDKSAKSAIVKLRKWLGMTRAQLEAAAERWDFELDDPAYDLRVSKQPSGKWA